MMQLMSPGLEAELEYRRESLIKTAERSRRSRRSRKAHDNQNKAAGAVFRPRAAA